VRFHRVLVASAEEAWPMPRDVNCMFDAGRQRLFADLVCLVIGVVFGEILPILDRYQASEAFPPIRTPRS
jgi:hypothetical protein